MVVIHVRIGERVRGLYSGHVEWRP